jgi:hypothetical protein
VIRTATVAAFLAVGPTFAGDSVMWGETGHTGALRVMQGGAGDAGVLVHRVPQPAKRRSWRQFVALEASGERFALTFSTATPRSGDETAIAVTAVGGHFTGPVEALGPCDGDESIAVDGDRIAVGSRCGVAVYGPAGVTTVEAEHVQAVALAGRHLAWAGEDEVVVHDLVAGAVVLRLAPVGAAFLDEVAVQPDGAVAFSYGSGQEQRLGWAAPGAPGVRRLDAAARFDDLRAAGGRVLYERRSGPREGRRVLVLRSLRDGTARQLARFTSRRTRIGDLDLEPGRAMWAVRPSGKSTRILMRDL